MGKKKDKYIVKIYENALGIKIVFKKREFWKKNIFGKTFVAKPLKISFRRTREGEVFLPTLSLDAELSKEFLNCMRLFLL